MKKLTFPVMALVVVGGFVASCFSTAANAQASTLTLQCGYSNNTCSLSANFPGYTGPTSIYWSFTGNGAPHNASSCNNQTQCVLGCTQPTSAPFTVSVSVYDDNNVLLGSTSTRTVCS